jgi:parallel beta-helix repeat protein
MWMNNKKAMSISIVFLMITLGLAGIFGTYGLADDFSVSGAKIIVDAKGFGNYTTIQSAINSAKDGDTIFVWAGTYYENLRIDKGITLIGNGTQNTIINGSRNGDVVYITANSVKLTGFNITYGGNRTYPHDDSGIELNFVSNVQIFGNSISHSAYGIYLNCSDYNLIEDNYIFSNIEVGIGITSANYNTVQRNFCTSSGLGIGLSYSGNNTILNNSCYSNSWSGIMASDANYNDIYNNSCSLAYFGLELWFAGFNDIAGNAFNNNTDCGVQLLFSDSNTVQNNSIVDNLNAGINMELSNSNTIKFNQISRNWKGITLAQWADGNSFFENLISANGNIGVSIESECYNNLIFHNNILANSVQAVDKQTGDNYWYQSNSGNYWSDYNGLDDGSNDRITGDGIGDTNLPHLGLDDYPYLRISGWQYMGVPVLDEPGEIDSDGNYELTWYYNPLANAYILQEDTSAAFTNPTEVLNGPFSSAVITDKPEGTYFYRLKGLNDKQITDWSEIVNITVNFKPGVPTGLKATDVSEGNTLNLTWSLNEDETLYYELEYKDDLLKDWEHLAKVDHPKNYHCAIALEDQKTYFFHIKAIDSFNQSSEFSTTIQGIPKDTLPPSAPQDLVANVTSDTEINLSWTPSPEVDVAGYKIYQNKLGLENDDSFKLHTTLDGQYSNFVVSGLDEQTTYQFKIVSFDEVPLDSKFSNTATATTIDVTPPEPPKGLTVSGATNCSLELSWKPNLELDLVGYHIYRNLAEFGDFERLNSEPVTNTKYVDTKLNESTRYYYKVIAVDDFNLTSEYSQTVFGNTKLSEYPPEINNSISGVMILEDTADDQSINLLRLFKDVNGDQLMFDFDELENITVIIYQKNGTVILIPKENWNGETAVTFYAMDGIFTVSTRINISVLYWNDPPYNPKIISPQSSIEIAYGEPITLSATCDDHDLVYGDTLSYIWSSDLSGKLGNGQTLKDIDLKVGTHTIKVEVIDTAGQKAAETITVTVNEKETRDDKKDNSEDSNNYLIILVFIIIMVIIQTSFLYVKKIRKKKSREQNDSLGENSESQFEPGNYPVTPENQPNLIDTKYNQYSMMNQYQTTTPMNPYDPQLQTQPYDPQLQAQPYDPQLQAQSSYPQLVENNALQDTQYVQDTQDNQEQPGLNEESTSEEENVNQDTVL